MDHDDIPLPEPSQIPELALGDSRRYHMNMDWVWSRKYNRRLQKTATVRGTVIAEDPLELKQRFSDWSAHLRGPDSDGVFVQPGWSCQLERFDGNTLVLCFSSGGEDVADSLNYGIQWFSGAVLQAIPSSTVTWGELPLHKSAATFSDR